VTADQQTSADSATAGAAGVESTGNIATGPEAVAQMTRQGDHCALAEGDKARTAQWDMASSPTTLNPCSTGTMTLPKVVTER